MRPAAAIWGSKDVLFQLRLSKAAAQLAAAGSGRDFAAMFTALGKALKTVLKGQNSVAACRGRCRTYLNLPRDMGMANEDKIMETYIIHIYRFQKNNPRGLVGTVESVETTKREKSAFTNVDELWEILNCLKDADLPKRSAQKTKTNSTNESERLSHRHSE